MVVMVNFQLSKCTLNVKDNIINNITSKGRRKNLSPERNQTNGLYPLRYKNSWRVRTFN